MTSRRTTLTLSHLSLSRRILSRLCTGLAGATVFFVISASSASATAFTVNSTCDTGDGTPDGICNDGSGNCCLREALDEAAGDGGGDGTYVITISLASGGAPYLITPGSAYPSINGVDVEINIDSANARCPVYIDGTNVSTVFYWQNAPTKFEIDGYTTNACGGSNDIGIGIGSAGGNGIWWSGAADNVIRYAYIGVDAGGNDRGNTNNGFRIDDDGVADSDDATIEYNVIANNGDSGGRLDVDGTVQVNNNLVGLAPNGSSSAGNGDHGIGIYDGTVTVNDNVMSCNGDAANENGLDLGEDSIGGDESTVDSSNVYDNMFGTDDAGAVACANTGAGINMAGPNHSIHDNLISGNTSYGILTNDGPASSEVSTVYIYDNLIGTDVTGESQIANNVGIGMKDCHSTCVIGEDSGGTAGPNTVSGNTVIGIELESDTNQATVVNNFIGTDDDGLTDGTNGGCIPGSGVGIDLNSGNTLNGLSDFSDANVISCNTTGININIISHSPEIGPAHIYYQYIGVDANGNDTAGFGNSTGIAITAHCTGGSVIANNIINQSTAIGIQATTPTNCTGVTISGNEIGNGADQGINLNGTTNYAVTDNNIHDNGGNGAFLISQIGLDFSQNDVIDNGSDPGDFGVILGASDPAGPPNQVYRNDISGSYIGVASYLNNNSNGSGNFFHTNFIYSNVYAGLWSGGNTSDDTNAYFVNNNLYHNGGSEIMLGDTGQGMTSAGATVMNNVIVPSSGQAGIDVDPNSTANYTGAEFDYNDVYYTGGGAYGAWGATTCSDLATWQGGTCTDGGGTNSLEVDPEYVGAPSDLHISATSPVINQGADVTGGNVTEDYDGGARPFGGGWDMGADEQGSDDEGDGIPEFSLLTLVLAIGLGLGTFGFVRRREEKQ